MDAVRVLIVEDNPVVALDLKQILVEAGIEVSGTLYQGEKVMDWLKENEVDLILMDIQLAGKMTGIEVAKKISLEFKIPLVFLTAFQDKETMQEALATTPASFLSKPFRAPDLIAAIDLAVRRDNENKNEKTEELQTDSLGTVFQSGEYLYCKAGNTFKRIEIKSILWIEADGSYSHFVTDSGRITITEPLGKTEEKLSAINFVRIHRSFMVNVKQVTSFHNRSVFIGEKELPLAKAWEEAFLNALRKQS